jgi:hypothetical protein
MGTTGARRGRGDWADWKAGVGDRVFAIPWPANSPPTRGTRRRRNARPMHLREQNWRIISDGRSTGGSGSRVNLDCPNRHL